MIRLCFNWNRDAFFLFLLCLKREETYSKVLIIKDPKLHVCFVRIALVSTLACGKVSMCVTLFVRENCEQKAILHLAQWVRAFDTQAEG